MMNSESDEKNLPQKISEDIIDFILNQHLQPGDKLPNEAILSKQLDIGRSSLRAVSYTHLTLPTKRIV